MNLNDLQTKNLSKINFIADKDDYKYLGFQYYDLFNYITIPLHEKVPFIKDWQKSKHTIHPTYTTDNTGLLTGITNDLFVLDIDVKDDGLKLWNKLIDEKLFILPKTPITKTGSGGLHIYFKYDDSIPNINKLKINDKIYGWDILSNGKQVVVPPSIINGNKYKWINSFEDCNLKKIPAKLKKFILNHKR